MTKKQFNDAIKQVTRESMRPGRPERYVDAVEAFSDSMITIVDSDPLVCETLTEMIRSRGLRAEGFIQAQAALAYIRKNKCDIVLLDLFIFDVCGSDLLHQISVDPSEDLKIIIMSELAHKNAAIRALQLGAFDLLEKPIHNELLYHSILRALTALAYERRSKRLIDDLKQNRSELLANQQMLENLSAQLRDANRALTIVSKNTERERKKIEKQTALKLRNLIIPIIAELTNDQALHDYEPQLDMLTEQIEDLTCGFALDPSVVTSLSSTQLLIACLIKNGMTTEEIAKQLHIAENTVRTHRRKIRKKLHINHPQYSLRNFLNFVA